MKLVHGSLFSGFDAPSVAASWMGWKNAFHCEINPFCNDILKYWFPNSEHYEDITKTDFSQWRGRIDILTGGFPCQPFSLAGQRKGADDNRYLWPHMLRAIREIRPAWVIGENVAGILTMVQPGKETEVGSQTSLFGEDNRKRILLRQEYVVETVCKDLEREGYSVQPLLIPACAVGAPHRRDRVWFVARLITDTACRGSGGTPHESCCENERQNGYKTQQPFVRGCVRASSHSDGERCNNRSDNWKERPICYDQKRYSEEDQSKRDKRKCRTCKNGSVASDSQCSGSGQIQQKIQFKQSDGNSSDRNGSEWDVTYSDTSRLSTLRLPSNTETEGWKDENGQPLQSSSNARGTLLTEWWQNFPTQSPVCRGNDGVPFNVDNLTIPFTKWRKESIKGYGNAIVPQVILEIFKAIEEIEQLE
ncbi:DNA cytosine methyltransferase [Bacteroides thetaiotaomicron]|uniref:DNA cytosine methyltransferase n=1 Tax=Bacteroides thetaiotaomicron TaxID=818 RepID=UPI0039C4915B